MVREWFIALAERQSWYQSGNAGKQQQRLPSPVLCRTGASCWPLGCATWSQEARQEWLCLPGIHAGNKSTDYLILSIIKLLTNTYLTSKYRMQFGWVFTIHSIWALDFKFLYHWINGSSGLSSHNKSKIFPPTSYNPQKQQESEFVSLAYTVRVRCANSAELEHSNCKQREK